MDYLLALREENAAFYSAVDPARLAARVEPCPEWDLADLVWHMGKVHWFWGSIVEDRPSDPSGVTMPDRPPGDGELLDWARSCGDRLQRVLADTDPADEVWTWSSQRDVAFIRRRMAHETAVHRWDAQQTTPDGSRPIDAALAVDGIDEFVSVFVPYLLGEGEPFVGSVHLHCTDVEGEWLIRPDGSHSVGHIKGDAALRGPASDLLLALWRRVPLDRIEILGDRAVAEHLIERSRIE